VLRTLTCTHKQLSGVTSGLRFLHENGLVHGDLRPVREATSLLMRINAFNRATS